MTQFFQILSIKMTQFIKVIDTIYKKLITQNIL